MTIPNTGIDMVAAAAAVFFVSTTVLAFAATISTRKLHDARRRIETLSSDVEWFRSESQMFQLKVGALIDQLEKHRALAAAVKPAPQRTARYKKTAIVRSGKPARTSPVATHDTSANVSDGVAVTHVATASSYSSSCDSSSSSSSSSSCD